MPSGVVVVSSFVGGLILFALVNTAIGRWRTARGIRSGRGVIVRWHYQPDEWQRCFYVVGDNKQSARTPAEVIISPSGMFVGNYLREFTGPITDSSYEPGSPTLLHIDVRKNGSKFNTSHRYTVPVPRGHELEVSRVVEALKAHRRK